MDLYTKVSKLPQGRRIFSLLFSQKAPYFATIRPRFTVIEPNHAELVIRKRRRVHNHLGTVHAIALCNLAELTAGLMTDASLPPGMRWIPKGMSVQYLKKARGRLRGVAGGIWTTWKTGGPSSAWASSRAPPARWTT